MIAACIKILSSSLSPLCNLIPRWLTVTAQPCADCDPTRTDIQTYIHLLEVLTSREAQARRSPDLQLVPGKVWQGGQFGWLQEYCEQDIYRHLYHLNLKVWALFEDVLYTMTGSYLRLRSTVSIHVELAISGMFPNAQVLPFASAINRLGSCSMILVLDKYKRQRYQSGWCCILYWGDIARWPASSSQDFFRRSWMMGVVNQVLSLGLKSVHEDSQGPGHLEGEHWCCPAVALCSAPWWGWHHHL